MSRVLRSPTRPAVCAGGRARAEASRRHVNGVLCLFDYSYRLAFEGWKVEVKV